MATAEQRRRSHFSLRLEQGLGRLVLSERPVGRLFCVEDLQLALPEVPSRIDMSGGVERFRHQRSRLERMVLYAEDQDIGRALRARLRGGPVTDVEVRALDGELVFLGELSEAATPFIARARIEPASVADERVLLVSVYALRIFGPARIAAPLVAAELLRGLGLGERLSGPSLATVDPVDILLLEICAELGWKAPDRRDVRLVESQCTAGRIRLTTARQQKGRVGPRGLALENTSRSRRFLADYEAKTLYASTEALIEEGQIERAITAYDRQHEVHPDHPFLVNRLLQLNVTPAGNLADAAALAKARLARYPDDLDALCALAVVQQRQGQPNSAAATLSRLAEVAEQTGDTLEAAQARCAMAGALAESDPPAAVRALEAALALRRRLPGALRALADLQSRTGDWAAALRTRERLLAREEDPDARQALFHSLGQVALEQAGDLDAAVGYFERALEAQPEDVEALIGLATAQERAGRVLPAVRTLDRAARILQERGDHVAAADAMVRLGDLWRRDPAEGSATAALRYRQALMLVPGHPGALFGLAEAALADGEPARARNALEELLRVIDEGRVDVDRNAVYLRLGEVLAGPNGDPPLAVAYYQKALSGTEAQAERALAALEELHARAERWDDVTRVLEMAVERAPDPVAKGQRLARLAGVVRARHDDELRAVKLLEEAATLRRDDPAVLESLATIHREGGRHAALEAVLGRICDRLEAPERLAATYAERGDLLRLHLNRTDDAAQCYSLALGCAPDHREALEGLADIYRERERFGELATLLERLALVLPASESGLIWLELGRLQARVLDRPRPAVDSYEKARVRRPDDPEVLRPLGDLLFEQGRPAVALPHYEALYGIYEAEGYDEPQAPFLLRIAEVLDALDRGADALAYLQKAAEADPDRMAVYEQAQDTLLRQGDVEGIVQFFEAGLKEALRPSVRRFLAKRAGRLAWRELRRPEQAAPLLDEVLRGDPEDTDVRRMRLEVATALADWPRVAELLRAQLERAEARERPALLTSLAKLAYTALERPDEGTQLALAALGEQPDYQPALTLLGERSFAASDWVNVRRAYAGLAEAEGRGARPEDVYRLALAERALGEEDAARVRLARLHADGRIPPDGLDLLVALLIEADDAEALAAVLDDRLALGEPLADRRAVLRAVARVLGRHEAQRQRALDCWEALLDTLPDDPEALAALRAGGRLPEEEEPQPLEMPGLPEPTAPEGARRPGRALHTPRVDPPEATPSAGPTPDAPTPDAPTSDAPAASPSEPPPDAAEVIERLAARGGAGEPDQRPFVEREASEGPDDELPPLEIDPDASAREAAHGRAAALEAELAETVEPDARARLFLELAELRRDRLHDPDGSVPALIGVLDNAEPAGPLWVEALEALEDLHALREEWDALLALYDRREQAGMGTAAELNLLRASILRTAGRLDEAIAAAERAAPTGGRALDLLVSLLRSAGRVEEAAARVLKGLDRLSPVEAAHRRWRAAELLTEGDPPRALALLAEAHAEIDDPEVVEQWIALARRVDDARALLDALEAQAATLGDSGPDAVRRSSALAEAGALAADQGAPTRARRLFEASLSAWPDNVEAMEHLAGVLSGVSDHEALADLRARQIEAALPGPHRGELALDLARLFIDALGDVDGAERWLDMAAADLEGTDAFSAVVGLRGRRAAPPLDWNTLAERAPDEVVDALVERAEALAADPRARMEAARLLEEALGLAPHVQRAYALLESIYAGEQRWGELCGVIERHVATIGARPERAELLLRRARITERALGDDEGAAGAYERALIDPAGTAQVVAAAVDALVVLRPRRLDLERVRRLLDERIDHAADDRVRAGLHTVRGVLWQSRLGHIGRARADLEAAVRLDPRHGRAHLALGLMALDRGDASDATVHLDRALLSDGGTLTPAQIDEAFEGLRRALEKLGRADEVPMLAEEVLARHPDARAPRAVAGDDSVETAPLPELPPPDTTDVD